jgi:2-isopropylmalate synthase
VDAIFKAIDGILKTNSNLLEFSVHAVTEGIDALGEVTVRVEAPAAGEMIDAQKEMSMPRTFGGYGADTDIIVASAKAYLSALNKVLAESSTPAEQSTGMNVPSPASGVVQSELKQQG